MGTGRSAESRGKGIPAKVVDEGEVNHFIQKLEEMIFGDYPVVDMFAVEGKLT